MYKFFSNLFLMVCMLSILSGCNSDVIDSPVYNGKYLVIGVLGEPPQVREKNVCFEKMTFEYLNRSKGA
ncbi:hypothetical protein D3C76_62530 [compost metagenome]